VWLAVIEAITGRVSNLVHALDFGDGFFAPFLENLFHVVIGGSRLRKAGLCATGWLARL
jgi:hypothetical protein